MNTNNKEIVKVQSSLFPRLFNRLKEWASSDFYTQSFSCGTSHINDLMCFIDSVSLKNDCVINNKNNANLSSDLLIISGYINHKKLELIKKEYELLKGKKFVVTIGSEIKNINKMPDYNLVKDLNDFIPVDLHIHGNPPSLRDILNGLNMLKDLRSE